MNSKGPYHFHSVIKMFLSAKLPIPGLAPDLNQMEEKIPHPTVTSIFSLPPSNILQCSRAKAFGMSTNTNLQPNKIKDDYFIYVHISYIVYIYIYRLIHTHIHICKHRGPVFFQQLDEHFSYCIFALTICGSHLR